MDNKFYKVDLHVHTPASKCYKGVKDEEGYWQILKSAVENGVRMIAITDHNTIEGYETLMRLKDSALQEYRFAQKYSVSEQESIIIQEHKNLFDQVAIILGVEITVNPGVHIIVLSDEESKHDLDDLLTDLGYSSDKRGCDDIVTEKDVNALLSDQRLTGKIVLAPHVDSDKGIWKVLEGTYRASIFKSNVISAITCNNTKQLENIRELTRNDTEYKRIKPFVCINASDAHEQKNIGKKHSYFKLLDFSFNDLKRSIESPEDSISDTEKQDFIDYVKKCTEYKPTIYINDINDVENSMCAIMNNGDGCILLGFKEKYKKSGMSLDCQQIEDTVNQVFKGIKEKNNTRYTMIKCRTEQLGNGKSVGVIVIKSNESRLLINSNDQLNIFDEKKGYKLASIRETEELIQRRILIELKDFSKKNDRNILETIDIMRSVLNPVSKYAIYDKVKLFCVPITYYFDIEAFTKVNKNEKYEKMFKTNGQALGNTYFTVMTGPRYEDSYVRFSCPVYQNDDIDYCNQLTEIKTSSIVFYFGGGCHIIEANEPCYFECHTPSVLLKPNERFYKDNISMYHIIAWLKSNIFIWASLQKDRHTFVLSPMLIRNYLVPYIRGYYDDKIIKDKVEAILSLEKEFLGQFEPLIQKEDNESYDKASKLCEDHNNKVNKIASEIEALINHYVGVDEEECALINSNLTDEKIFIYNEKKS